MATGFGIGDLRCSITRRDRRAGEVEVGVIFSPRAGVVTI
jgi:hypothetical protein